MSKHFRTFLLGLFASIVVLQLTGVEQAFCDDHAAESSCHECISCALNPVAEPPRVESYSGVPFVDYAILAKTFLLIEEPSFVFLRPPIFC